MKIPLLLAAQLRTIETRFAHLPLMERAGTAATKIAVQLLAKRQAAVLIFAGPGNNGGDARVVARLLKQQGIAVDVCAIGDEPPARNYGLVIDGLFGIGLTRPITGAAAALIERINEFDGPILALDVPSGLNADTGQTIGATVKATHTATFIAAKPGLYTLDGPDHCGIISIHPIGLSLENEACAGAVLSTDELTEILKPRPNNCHKGSHGSLAIVGGAEGMTGAALLAARAGLHLGAGRTFVGLLSPLAVDPVQPELMLRHPEDAIAQATTLVVGPGLGLSSHAHALLRLCLSADVPMLLDADALNLLAAHPVAATHLARRKQTTLLTPHPAEAARLLRSDTSHVQADRIQAAIALATRFNAIVALKGNGTVLAHPDGRWRINTTGNSGLATGGTGDVLAGMAGALLAQNWPGWEALCAAVHLHGAAADQLVQTGVGPIGLTASELIPTTRALLNSWTSAAP